MKKIFISLLVLVTVVFSTISTYAFDSNKVGKVLNHFYEKLDYTYSDTQAKIEKLETIISKIKYIKSEKWNNIDNNSKKLIQFLEENLQQKIENYKSKQKESISLYDILGEEEANEKTVTIDSRYVDSEKNNHYSYSANEVKKGSKIKFGEFTINANGNFTVVTEFKDYKHDYPEVDLDDLYLEDKSGNKIHYNNKIASLGVTKQEFKDAEGNTEYTLYGISKKHYGNDDSFWVSLNTINGNQIGRVLGVIKYESK